MLKSDLRILSLKAEFLSEKDCRIPSFTGSMLRGAFGHSLKKVFCTMHHRDCTRCILSSGCGYFRMFESVSGRDRQAGFYYRPHPYVLCVPSGGELKQNESLFFNVHLLGEAVHWSAHVIAALQIMGELGFGAQRDVFRLTEVTDAFSGQKIWSENGSSEEGELCIRSLREIVTDVPYDPDKRFITLEFATMVRLTHHGKDVRTLTAEVLSASVISRYRNLHRFYGTFNEEDILNLPLLIIKEKSVKPASVKRHSSRQKRTVELRGIRGSFTAEITDPRWYYILKAMEIVNIGKNSGFGLGQIKLRSEYAF